MLKLAAQSSSSLLKLELTTALAHQQTRNVRIRKPPWANRAKNKLFRVPPFHQQEPTEHAYMRPIW